MVSSRVSWLGVVLMVWLVASCLSWLPTSSAALSFSNPQNVESVDYLYGNLSAVVYQSKVYVTYRLSPGPDVDEQLHWSSSPTGIDFQNPQRVDSVLTSIDPALVVLNDYLYIFFAGGQNAGKGKILYYTLFNPSTQMWSSAVQVAQVDTEDLTVVNACAYNNKVYVAYSRYDTGLPSSYGSFLSSLTQTPGTGALTLATTVDVYYTNNAGTYHAFWVKSAVMVASAHYGLIIAHREGNQFTEVITYSTDPDAQTNQFQQLDNPDAAKGSTSGYSGILFTRPSPSGQTIPCDVLLSTWYDPSGYLNYQLYIPELGDVELPSVTIKTSDNNPIFTESLAVPVIIGNELIIYFKDASQRISAIVANIISTPQ